MKKLLFILLLANTALSQTYVNQAATGSNNGTSWTNAYTDLQDALTNAQANDTIWVAAGTYKPTTTTNRDISFVIPDSVKVYGGFAGNEPAGFDLYLRNFEVNETILSGNIGNQASKADNSFHVVRFNQVSDQTLIDGFTIREGYALHATPVEKELGGGILNDGRGNGNSSKPIIKNINFIDNEAASGGALYNYAQLGEASPTVINCFFLENKANNGGAVFNNADNGKSAPYFENCVFAKNTSGSDGGAVYNFARNTNGINASEFVNCTFFNTRSNRNGEVLFALNSSASPAPRVITKLRNCIIWNEASGRTIYETRTESQLTNCLVKESNCTVMGLGVYCFGGMVFNGDPSFQNIAANDFSIKYDSQAKKAGNNHFVSTTLDFEGKPRIVDGKVDIGAYEYMSNAYIFVDKEATGANNGTSWNDAFTNLQSALALGSGDKSIWVAKGTYYPSSVNRFTPFVIPDSVKVYGGFKGNEELSFDLDYRDLYKNETILSGDYLNTPNDDSDNSCNVVKTVNVSPLTILDGMTITKGNADQRFSTSFDRGGGWFNDGSGTGNSSSPSVNRCRFVNNRSHLQGGAFFSNSRTGGITNVTFSNCQFFKNESQYGGAVAHEALQGATNPIFINCTFSLNKSERGGAIYTVANQGSGHVEVTNSTFYGNEASEQNKGHAIYSEGVSSTSMTSTIQNTIFNRNTVGQYLTTDSPIYNWDASTTLIHSFVTATACSQLDLGFGSHGVTCNVGMVYTFDDPLFANPDIGDLRLQSGSLAIDAGVNSVINTVFRDQLLRDRLIGSAVDMGAHEYISKAYVKANAQGKNNGSSWQDAFLHPRLATLESDTVWVAKGLYYPTYDDDRFKFIEVKSGQQLLGGFEGNEPSDYYVPLRNINENTSLISGNIGDTLIDTDNSIHIIRTFNVDTNTLVSGFTLVDAYNNSFFLEGGAFRNDTKINQQNLTVFSSPKVEYCTFKNNYAVYGGAYGSTTTQPTSAKFYRCNFENNSAQYGGAVANSLNPFLKPLSFKSCVFEGNSALHGGAIYSRNTSTTSFLNSKFYDNYASSTGSVAFAGYISEPIFSTTNDINKLQFSFCSISNNNGSIGAISTQTDGGSNDSIHVKIDNTILWDNNLASGARSYRARGLRNKLDISYSVVKETNCSDFQSPDNIVNCGPGMVYAQNPNMIDPSAGFFQLKCNSIAIDNADPTYNLTNDILNHNRIGVGDIGAYEYDSFLVVNEEVDDDKNPQLGGIEKIIGFSKILNTNNSTYQASKSVELRPGFEVSPMTGNASVFRAEIGGSCP